MGGDLWGIGWLVVLLLANAFFVGAEFAVISARRSQIETRAEAGNRSAKTALWAMEHATLMLATSQLGITICSLLILNVSEPALHHLLEVPLSATGLSVEVIGGAAFVIALLLVTFLHVVFGEMVPKNISFSVPDRAVLLLAPPLVGFSRVFRPIIFTLNWLANAVVRLFGVQPKDEATSAYTLEEVATIVQQSTKEGVLTDQSGTLSAAFEFTAKTAADIEVPLSKLIMVSPSVTPAELRRIVAEHGYSRYVVTDDDHQPRGYLHLKDVLDIVSGPASFAPVPADRIRELIAIDPAEELEDTLAAMSRTGRHIARVAAADRSATGVVFLEDILEELVGEVHDAASN